MLKKLFTSLMNRVNRYTEWTIVQRSIPGQVIINGVQQFRNVDIYERYDKVTKMYERKYVYLDSTKVLVGINDSLSSGCYFRTK